MSDGYCFISYSNADGLEFATRLATELEGGHPFIKVWFDKNEMSSSGSDWDDQISSAISQCKCLLFVMSEDSTGKGSNCKEEWTWALKCKKPVICLVIGEKFEEQFRLNNRQKVFFNSNFDAGLAQLKIAIARLDSPEGELGELNHRLAEAKRDFHRAKEGDKARIKIEIEELDKKIKRQEDIVKNPKKAEEQTRKNIEAGLERERQPEKLQTGKTVTRFINPPPGIAPNYFQDRQAETKELIRFILDDSQRMMTIVGRSGAGKTAMICRLLKGLEIGELPDGLGTMKVDGIVYLSEAGSHRINFANIFYDLCKLLPNELAQELEEVYKNPQGSTESKMRSVLEKFTDGRVILLLDNLEPLINIETFGIGDLELQEALNAFLQGIHTNVNIVITSRIAPRSLNLIQPGRQRLLFLDQGLDSPYAEQLLRELDSDGRVGFKNAPEPVLTLAKERTGGYPRALEALYQSLVLDRYTNLNELLPDAGSDNVVEMLVKATFSRLDSTSQKVIQALAIYNRPVTPTAIDFLLSPFIPTIDSASILQRLSAMQFARHEGVRYFLHPADREYAISIIPINRENVEKISSDIEFSFTQHDLTNRAADYFAQARKPRAEWKKLEDLSAQLAEFDLRCAAGDYDTAASVLTDFDFDYLLLWGHYRLMIELYEKIQGKIIDKTLARASAGNLGTAYFHIGQARNTIRYYEIVLELARKENAKQHEGAALGNLGLAYSALGDAYKAIEFYEKGLFIVREIGDRKGEGDTLNNIGSAYKYLGNTQKAIEHQEEALRIAQEIGDKSGESSRLGNLGNRYSELADFEKAIEYYKKSFLVSQKLGRRYSESTCLENIGDALLNFEEFQKAKESYQQAIQIADEISLTQIQNGARCGLAQVYILQNDLVNARATIEAALGYDVPQNNHNVSALHGIIALRQGDEVTARGAFVRAIGQADEILSKTAEYYSALDAKGLAICGLVLCRGAVPAPDGDTSTTGRGDPAPTVNDAIETFRKAREIASHAGVVKSVLRLFDELAKCDSKGILKDVRKAVEGAD